MPRCSVQLSQQFGQPSSKCVSVTRFSIGTDSGSGRCFVLCLASQILYSLGIPRTLVHFVTEQSRFILENQMTITYLPMNQAPDRISGGFNYSQRLYSVAKKGALTLLATADPCTHEGDQKVVRKVDKNIPRIAIETVRSGNGSWDSIAYYKA